MNNFERYDFKIFIPKTDILCFRAYVIDRDNYTIFEIPDLGIDENYKNIFLRIIKGEFLETFYKKSEIKDNKLPEPISIVINSNNAIENINKFKSVSEYFGMSITNELITLHEAVTFRFDGPSLNAKYGLLRKEANTIESISNSLMNIILESVNNINFGTVLQMPLRAGSTKVQFDTEKVNTDALNVVRRIFRDINDGNIDINYINDSTNQYAVLYKKFALELKRLKSIKDLKEFQIKLFGDTSFDNELINFKYLDEIEQIIYNNSPVSGNGKIKYYKGQLLSKQKINSLVVDYNGNEITLHFYNDNDDFDRFHRISNSGRDTEIYFEGFKDGGDRTVLITEMSTVTNNPNT